MSSQAAGGQPQGAGQSSVAFTRQAAQRIAAAVRVVEGGDRGQPGVTFDHPVPSGRSPLRVGTFTGSWSTGTYKTVTLVGGTNTASVYNWCVPSYGDTSNTSQSQYVIFGRASGTNSVVEISYRHTSQTCRMSIAGADLTELPGYSASSVQLLGHSAAGGTNCPTLTWYSVTTCSTSTAA